MSAALAEGTVFAGRYRIAKRIAVGGMGAVYEAVHLETGRRRALKVMHAHVFQSAELRERFKQEARIAAQIESEHIVDVSDAGVDEATDTPFLVMELLRGEELSRRIKRGGPLPPAEAISALHQMAMALDRTHAASIIHRDLKPENVFLCQRDDGSILAKILDFGVAKLIADGSATGGATQSLGTPLYMAPEQFRSSLKLTPAADTYALGLVAYTMLVGQPYWQKEAREVGESFAFAFVAALGPKHPPVARAAEVGVRLPTAFDAWFARVTSLEPSARIYPASEVVRTLAEVLGVALPAPVRAAALSAPLLPEDATASDPTLLRLPRGSDAGPSGHAGGAPHAPGPAGDRTTTEAPMTAAPRGPGRGSIVAIAAAAVVVALAAGAWLGRSTSNPTSTPGAPDASSASLPAPVEARATAAPPSPSPAAVTALPATLADARSAPTPALRAPASATRPPPAPKARTTNPLPKLLGRD